MPTSPNVTTPGGFFIGLGGIVSFCIVSVAIYIWVKSPPVTGELRAQQIALGLDLKDEAKAKDVKKLLSNAKMRYNGGVDLDLDNLDDLRGVVRYREAENRHATMWCRPAKNATAAKNICCRSNGKNS